MLDLQKLKTFLVVAQTSSFTRAALEPGYSQSSVTTHVKALERELGAAVFDRGSKHVILTSAGRHMLEYASRLLDLADETKAAIHKNIDLDGTLSMSAPEALVAYRLPKILRQFRSLYSRVQVALTTYQDCHTRIDALLEGRLDLALVLDQHVRRHQLATIEFGLEQVVIVAAADHELSCEPNPWEQRFLVTPQSCPFRRIFERGLAEAQISLADTLTFESIEAIKQCAMAGMGLAALPEMAVTEEIKDKRLIQLPWNGPQLSFQVQMARHRKRAPAPALHAFWSLAERSWY